MFGGVALIKFVVKTSNSKIMNKKIMNVRLVYN